MTINLAEMEIDESLQGRLFGKLRVIGFVSAWGKWLCRCKCSRYRAISEAELKSGLPESSDCGGCLSPKEPICTADKSLGRRFLREYRAWLALRKRGVLCVEWSRSFTQFLEFVGPCPDGMRLQRKPGSTPISPRNPPSWGNKRRIHFGFVLDGNSKILDREFCARHDIEPTFLRGWKNRTRKRKPQAAEVIAAWRAWQERKESQKRKRFDEPDPGGLTIDLFGPISLPEPKPIGHSAKKRANQKRPRRR